jgi:hypothetical protein
MIESKDLEMSTFMDLQSKGSNSEGMSNLYSITNESNIGRWSLERMESSEGMLKMIIKSRRASFERKSS